jgi:hypothetical protein
MFNVVILKNCAIADRKPVPFIFDLRLLEQFSSIELHGFQTGFPGVSKQFQSLLPSGLHPPTTNIYFIG